MESSSNARCKNIKLEVPCQLLYRYFWGHNVLQLALLSNFNCFSSAYSSCREEWPRIAYLSTCHIMHYNVEWSVCEWCMCIPRVLQLYITSVYDVLYSQRNEITGDSECIFMWAINDRYWWVANNLFQCSGPLTCADMSNQQRSIELVAWGCSTSEKKYIVWHPSPSTHWRLV